MSESHDPIIVATVGMEIPTKKAPIAIFSAHEKNWS
jgi:hypothetical protein